MQNTEACFRRFIKYVKTLWLLFSSFPFETYLLSYDSDAKSAFREDSNKSYTRPRRGKKMIFSYESNSKTCRPWSVKVCWSQFSMSSSLWCQIRDSDYIIILKSYQSSLNSSVYPVLHGKLSKPYKTNLLQLYDILAIFHFNLNRRSRTIVEHVRSTWVSEKLVQSVL